MKRLFFLTLALSVLISAKAFASPVPDVSVPTSFTISDYYDPALPFRTVAERIGDIYFEIYGMDIKQQGSVLNFQIYTSYPEEGYTVTPWETFAGDLKLDVTTESGTKNFGVGFTTHGQPNGTGKPIDEGSLYEGATWNKSNAWAVYQGTTGYSYHKGQDVNINNYSRILDADLDVVWNDLGILKYYSATKVAHLYCIDVSVPLNKISDAGEADIQVHWAAADCANDYIDGKFHVVPEPTTLSLLGLGLLGLLTRKKLWTR